MLNWSTYEFNLIFQLHDGMFECSCSQGYELNKLDGYSCKPNNISFSQSLNESKLDEDYSSSDVFYQKGVSFSAKLEENETDDKNDESNDIDNQTKQFSTHDENSINHSDSGQKAKMTSNLTLNIPRFYQTSFLAFRPLKGKDSTIIIKPIIDAIKSFSNL